MVGIIPAQPGFSKPAEQFSCGAESAIVDLYLVSDYITDCLPQEGVVGAAQNDSGDPFVLVGIQMFVEILGVSITI